jgi:hypothetical protein
VHEACEFGEDGVNCDSEDRVVAIVDSVKVGDALEVGLGVAVGFGAGVVNCAGEFVVKEFGESGEGIWLQGFVFAADFCVKIVPTGRA